jgi:hypothetical protein
MVESYLNNLFEKDKFNKKESKIKNSKEWKKTWRCIHITKQSYRKKDGLGHAVCKNGKCKIHYDKANPLHNPIKHLIYDSPNRIGKTLIYPLATIEISLKKLLYKEKKYNILDTGKSKSRVILDKVIRKRREINKSRIIQSIQKYR